MDRARALRRDATLPERLLWAALRRKQLELRFRHQHPAGPYILDFYCPSARLCVEVDGNQHDLTAEADERRGRWLTKQGIQVIRVPATEVLADKKPPPWAVPDAPAAVSGGWQLLLDALSEDRKDDAAVLLTPLPPKIDEVDDPRFGNDKSDIDSLEEPYVPRRVYQHWQSDQWRTDFPPPPGFVGHEEGEWNEEGYWRDLSADELARLVTAGIAESQDSGVTIEEDEAERDSFFAGLTASA